MEAGFIDEAMASLQQCLAIDSGYQNCRQHLARLSDQRRRRDRAKAQQRDTRTHASIDQRCICFYLRSQRAALSALFIADARLGSAGAPVIEWIRAIENPDADNSSGLARLKDWERQTSSGNKLSSASPMFLSFRAYDELAENPALAWHSLWHPDGDESRTTPQFKTVMRHLGIFEYWQARGFAPQCKPVGDDDFECGRPLVE